MPKYLLLAASFLCIGQAAAQSLGAGTLRGVVTDATNAPIPSAGVTLSNPLTGYARETHTGTDGSFTINNVPPNSYQIQVSFTGFQTYHASLSIQTGVPLTLTIRLDLAGQQTSVTVHETAQTILENKATPSDIVGRQLLAALPALTPDSGLERFHHLHNPGRRRRLQRLLPSHGRPRAGKLRHRRPAHLRSAQQGIFHLHSRQRHPVHGSGVRLSSQPNTATRPA